MDTLSLQFYPNFCHCQLEHSWPFEPPSEMAELSNTGSQSPWFFFLWCFHTLPSEYELVRDLPGIGPYGMPCVCVCAKEFKILKWSAWPRGKRSDLSISLAYWIFLEIKLLFETLSVEAYLVLSKVDLTVSFLFLRSLYGRHMQANPEPPKKNNDKSKKISRKPLTAKNK